MIQIYIVFWTVFSLHCGKHQDCVYQPDQRYSLQASSAGVRGMLKDLKKYTTDELGEGAPQYVDFIGVREVGPDVTAAIAPEFAAGYEKEKLETHHEEWK